MPYSKSTDLRDDTREAMQAAVDLAVALGGDRRIAEAVFRRRVLHWIRQSTKRQERDNKGSYEEQLAQVRHLRPYGLQEGHHKIAQIDARGESGRRREREDGTISDRERFDLMIEALDTGEYGVLLVYAIDRISRNEEDAYRFLKVVRERRVLLLVNGRILNPLNRHDRMQMMVLMEIAALQSDEDIEKMMRGKHRRAESLALRNLLPSGLLHVHPKEPEYRRRMIAAGLGHLISDEAIATHQLQTELDGLTHYILPMPDREVYDSMVLRIQWLKETRSVAAVIKRIRAGYGGWPAGRAGGIPVIQKSLWRHNVDVEWVPVTPTRLRPWYRSAALYGTFMYTPHALKALESTADPEELDVKKAGAFPSIATAADWELVRPYLKNPGRKYARDPRRERRNYAGARDHALPYVLCACEVRDKRTGEVRECGRKMGPMYEPEGSFGYYCLPCYKKEGHFVRVTRIVDQLVVDAVHTALDPASIRRGLERVTVLDDETTNEIGSLTIRIEEQERLSATARRQATTAGASGEEELAQQFLADSAGYTAAAKKLREQLQQARNSPDAAKALRQEDVRRILALAADLPALFETARRADLIVGEQLRAARARGDHLEVLRLQPLEGQVRRLLEATQIRVLLRRTPTGDVEVLVEFPQGLRATAGIVDAELPRTAQAARHWAYRRVVVDGHSPAETAEEMNQVLPVKPSSLERWTAPRVRAAVAYQAGCEHQVPLREDGWTVPELATRIGVPEQEILSAAFRGKLGIARFDERGTFRLEATEAMCHRTFPAYAARGIAQRLGSPTTDLVPLKVLAREHRDMKRHRVLVKRLKARGLVSYDADGNPYARRSDYHVSDMDALRAAVAADPELASLDFRYWVRSPEVPRLLGVSLSGVLKKLPRCSLGAAQTRGSVVYVWLGPEVRARMSHLTLADAVVALRADTGLAYEEEDFLTFQALVDRLRALDRGISVPRLRRILASAPIPRVEAGTTQAPHRRWTHYYLPRSFGSLEGGALGRAVELWTTGTYKADPLP